MASEASPRAPQRRHRSSRSTSKSRVYGGRPRSKSSWAIAARCRQCRHEASTRCQATEILEPEIVARRELAHWRLSTVLALRSMPDYRVVVPSPQTRPGWPYRCARAGRRHPRPGVHVFGLQWRARETFVEIAHDRLGLVEREARHARSRGPWRKAGATGEAVRGVRRTARRPVHASPLSASASGALHT
jgi:hypothetical protein